MHSCWSWNASAKLDGALLGDIAFIDPDEKKAAQLLDAQEEERKQGGEGANKRQLMDLAGVTESGAGEPACK